MEPTQTQTEVDQVTAAVEEKLRSEKLLKYQQEMWIDYNALGGLFLEPDGTFKKSPRDPTKAYSVQDFADELKVGRTTLYMWRQTIPDFWNRVAARRKVLGAQTRVAKVWNGVFLKASAGHPEQAKMFLANFDPDFVMPNAKLTQDDANTLIDLMTAARQTARVIEGETVDHSDAKEGEVV